MNTKNVKIKSGITALVIGAVTLTTAFFIYTQTGEAKEDVSIYQRQIELNQNTYNQSVIALCESRKALASSKMIGVAHGAEVEGDAASWANILKTDCLKG